MEVLFPVGTLDVRKGCVEEPLPCALVPPGPGHELQRHIVTGLLENAPHDGTAQTAPGKPFIREGRILIARHDPQRIGKRR